MKNKKQISASKRSEPEAQPKGPFRRAAIQATGLDNLQLAMMQKRLNDKSNLLRVDEIRDDLNLRFERLNEKMNEEISKIL